MTQAGPETGMPQEPERRARVLFVDDEPRVLSSMRALFRRDYDVHLANSGSDALALLEREEFDVIVSDQRMPGLTGVDVLSACRTRAPRAMRILLTGYADKDAIAASINEGEVFRYLTKPCPRDELRETVALAVKAASVSHGSAAPSETARAAEGPVARSIVPAAPPEATPSSNPGVRSAPLAAADPPANPAIRSYGAERLRGGAQARGVEVLVLSCDPAFTQALEIALGSAHRVHAVERVEQAMDVLDSQPVGVLITDIAIHGDEVQALTSQLKHHVPELVTVVASDHSDACRLIDLINGGQVFRFLLKPIKPTQTAIWVEAAVTKHLQLVKDPELLARHVVPPPQESLIQLGDRVIRQLAARIFRARARHTGEPIRAGEA